MKSTEPSRLPYAVLVMVCLAAIPSSSAFPLVQMPINTLLVVGLLPEMKSPLLAGLLAAAAGWLMEATLRAHPSPGGIALANLTVVLLAHWSLLQWPPSPESSHRGRLAVWTLIHALLTWMSVTLAVGLHPFNYLGWLLALGTSPLWALPVARFHRPLHRR